MRETPEVLGPIVRLQVQAGHLKSGDPRRYDPGPIVPVDRLVIDADGVTGYTSEGVALLDVHNRRHPQSRFRGDNGISIGFVGHYRAMRDRFGDGPADGEAGENLLIGDDRIHSAVAGPVVIVTAGGPVRLVDVVAAPPCVEFTRYCLGRRPGDDEGVADGLRFLRGGMRGYYLGIDSDDSGPAEVGVGDLVLAGGGLPPERHRQ